MFIRACDGTLVNLDHFSRILTIPRNNDTFEVITKAPNGDYVHLAVGISDAAAAEYMKTLERVLGARDVALLAAGAASA